MSIARTALRRACGTVLLCALGLGLAMPPATAQTALANECIEVLEFNDGTEVKALSHTCASGPRTLATIAPPVDSYVQQQLNALDLGGFVAGPTAKLRRFDHEGLTAMGSGLATDAYEGYEESFFANGTYDVPGVALAGKVRLGFLVGWDRLSTKSEAPDDVLNYAGVETATDSIFYGGSVLWHRSSVYAMATVIGLNGNVEDWTWNNYGSEERTSYDISGVFTSGVVGNVFDLAAGLKLDLRAGLGYSMVESDTFRLNDKYFNPVDPVEVSAHASQLNASITANLFSVVNLEGGAVMRPYVLGTYRGLIDEELRLEGRNGHVDFAQANDIGKVELGADVVKGPVTFGFAAYTEFSDDEETRGLRLGASYKLQ